MVWKGCQIIILLEGSQSENSKIYEQNVKECVPSSPLAITINLDQKECSDPCWLNARREER